MTTGSLKISVYVYHRQGFHQTQLVQGIELLAVFQATGPFHITSVKKMNFLYGCFGDSKQIKDKIQK